MFGKDGKKKELIKKLDEIYKQIQREYQISPGKSENCYRGTFFVTSSVFMRDISSLLSTNGFTTWFSSELNFN